MENTSTAPETIWKPLRARATPAYRETPWSPAIEVEICHARFDAPSFHPYCPGLFVDRHIAPDARMVPAPRFSRDYPGCDEMPDGASVSLASGPLAQGAAQGGELYAEGDGKTRFQRDWDFLLAHAERAFERYRSLHLPLLSGESYLRGESVLTEWRKAQALALYARNWKTRIPRHGQSHHAVDTLLYSYHCAGPAEVLFALATVSGLKARRITISHHSMVEIAVGDRWVWCDNIVGGAEMLPCPFIEMLERLPLWPNFSDKQVKAYAAKEPFYRCPFQMDQTLAWRGGGFAGDAPGEGDAAHVIGLALAYNPATAKALYPHAPEHRIPGLAQDGTPRLILKEKQGWIHAAAHIPAGELVRIRYFLSRCDDNPVRSGEARIWVGKDTPPQAVSMRVDGQLLGPARSGVSRFVHPSLCFDLPAGALAPGEHEVVVRSECADGTAIVFYPDLLEPALDPVSADVPFSLSPGSIATDPVHEPPAI